MERISTGKTYLLFNRETKEYLGSLYAKVTYNRKLIFQKPDGVLFVVELTHTNQKKYIVQVILKQAA